MSANFLDSLRAWGESLFTAKKSWISAQAFPSDGSRIVIANETSGIYTAPADGYFGFSANNIRTVDIYVQNLNGSGDIYSRFTLSMPSGVSYTGSAVIPVSKGSRLIFSLDQNPSELWFIPTAGSQ